VQPQEKQSCHLVRLERSDAPEDLRKAINSFWKKERHERFPRLRADDVQIKKCLRRAGDASPAPHSRLSSFKPIHTTASVPSRSGQGLSAV
jgi:hypothetical protein